jgi:hypothetical protein
VNLGSRALSCVATQGHKRKHNLKARAPTLQCALCRIAVEEYTPPSDSTSVICYSKKVGGSLAAEWGLRRIAAMILAHNAAVQPVHHAAIYGTPTSGTATQGRSYLTINLDSYTKGEGFAPSWNTPF